MEPLAAVALLASLKELTREFGASARAALDYYDPERRCLVVVVPGEEAAARRQAAEMMTSVLEQIAVRPLIHVSVREYAASPDAPPAPWTYAAVELESAPPLVPLCDEAAQQILSRLQSLGAEQTARGRFGFLAMCGNRDPGQVAAVKAAVEQMLARNPELARLIGASVSPKLSVLFYDQDNQEFDEHEIACPRR